MKIESRLMDKAAFMALCAQHHPFVSEVNLHGNAQVTDDWLEALTALYPEKVILSGTRIGDAWLAYLSNMASALRHSLTFINLSDTRVTGAGLNHLLTFLRLKTVIVTGNEIPWNHPSVEALREHTRSHCNRHPNKYDGVILNWDDVERPMSAMY